MIYGGGNRVGLHPKTKKSASSGQDFKGLVDGLYTLLSRML